MGVIGVMRIFSHKTAGGILGIFILILFFSFSGILSAQEFTSGSFKVLDPVIDLGGGYSQSTDYELQSSLGQISIGPSLSANFGVNSGFQYYPVVSSPVISAVAADSQVAVSWTVANGTLGWTVGGYNVGVATVSGGPYTFTSVGNVTSKTVTSLTNGTTYYFVVQVLDALGNVITTSGEVSAIPVSSNPPPSICTDHSATNYGGSLPCTYPVPSGGGGGGGSGGSSPQGGQTGVNFSGRAYPLSQVDILEDGQIVVTTIADPEANFNVSISNLATGNYTFSVYGADSEGRRSSVFTFPIYITSGVVTNIGGIFLAPTIAVDKSEVKRGDNIAIFGQSIPNAKVMISVNSAQEFFEQTVSDKNGVYLYDFDTSPLALATHTTKSKTATSSLISPFSNVVSFVVGNKTVLNSLATCPTKGDLNGDCRVNLVDFSIAAYWYHRILSPTFAALEKKELSGDGKITLTDFSIMAYYWTG